MGSNISHKNAKVVGMLAKMESIFTLAQWREALGVKYGPDWPAAADALYAFKRQGIIENIPGTRRWKKVRQPD